MGTSTPGHGYLFANFASFGRGPPRAMAASSGTFGSGASNLGSHSFEASGAAQTAYYCHAPVQRESRAAYGSAAPQIALSRQSAQSRQSPVLPAASDEDSDESCNESGGTFDGNASLKHGAPPAPARQSSAPKYRIGSRGSRYQKCSFRPTAASNAEDVPQVDPLAQIISLQRFQGDGEFDQALLDVCGLANSSKAHALLIESSQISSWKSIWGTILVVVFLERNMVAEKDVWELVVDKAKDFLQQ